jgi:dTDP-glucose 4,6-dehydratase
MWLGGAGSTSPLNRYREITDGTARMLEFAASHSTRTLLLTSSGAIYGRQPDDVSHLPEDHTWAPDPLNPASVYGEGKLVSDLMCVLYSQGVPIEFSPHFSRCGCC